MNIRLGVYDIFSRIIPGGLYIIAIGQFLMILGLVNLDLQIINSLSVIVYIGLIVTGYVVGGAFDRFALIWFRLFEKKGFSARTFAEFKESRKDRWDINFRDDDWHTLLAFIRTKNLELSSEIDRYNALSIMLRNASLGILLMMVNQFVQFLISRQLINIVIGLVLFALSILIAQESVRFRGWFYYTIYETILAYRINLEDAIKPVRPKSKLTSSKKTR